MATNIVTTQTRAAVLVEDFTKFQIRTVVTDKGDLPDSGIFVLEIVDEEDPKKDTFVRVASAADFEAYPISRDEAVKALASTTKNYYRSTELVVEYDTIDTAVESSKVIKDLIDSLASTWDTYITDFYTTSDVTTHPTLNIDTLTELVNTYVDAKGAVDDAEKDRDTALSTLSDVETKYTDAQTTVDTLSEASKVISNLESIISSLSPVLDSLDSLCYSIGQEPSSPFGWYENEGSRFLGDVNNYVWAVKYTLNNLTSILSATSLDSQRGNLQDVHDLLSGADSTFNTALSSFVTDKNTYCNSSVITTAKSSLENKEDSSTILDSLETAKQSLKSLTQELHSATKDLEEKKAVLEAAKAAADKALADVVAVCPDFDPADPDAKLNNS